MVKTYSYSTIGKGICTPQFIFHVFQLAGKRWLR